MAPLLRMRWTSPHSKFGSHIKSDDITHTSREYKNGLLYKKAFWGKQDRLPMLAPKIAWEKRILIWGFLLWQVRVLTHREGPARFQSPRLNSLPRWGYKENREEKLQSCQQSNIIKSSQLFTTILKYHEHVVLVHTI